MVLAFADNGSILKNMLNTAVANRATETRMKNAPAVKIS